MGVSDRCGLKGNALLRMMLRYPETYFRLAKSGRWEVDHMLASVLVTAWRGGRRGAPSSAPGAKSRLSGLAALVTRWSEQQILDFPRPCPRFFFKVPSYGLDRPQPMNVDRCDSPSGPDESQSLSVSGALTVADGADGDCARCAHPASSFASASFVAPSSPRLVAMCARQWQIKGAGGCCGWLAHRPSPLSL